jgi:hypothetical protein
MGQRIMKGAKLAVVRRAKILFLPVSSKYLSLFFSIGSINCIGSLWRSLKNEAEHAK